MPFTLCTSNVHAINFSGCGVIRIRALNEITTLHCISTVQVISVLQ